MMNTDLRQRGADFARHPFTLFMLLDSHQLGLQNAMHNLELNNKKNPIFGKAGAAKPHLLSQKWGFETVPFILAFILVRTSEGDGRMRPSPSDVLIKMNMLLTNTPVFLAFFTGGTAARFPQ